MRPKFGTWDWAMSKVECSQALYRQGWTKRSQFIQDVGKGIILQGKGGVTGKLYIPTCADRAAKDWRVDLGH